jgi:hypothetical protein
MRRVQGLAHLADQLKRPTRFERALRRQECPQVGALNMAHRRPQLPVRLAGHIHGHDVGMIERGRQFCLEQEAFAEALVGSQLRRDQLERNHSPQPQIPRQIDNAHAPTSEHRLQPISGQIRANAGICLNAHPWRQA